MAANTVDEYIESLGGWKTDTAGRIQEIVTNPHPTIHLSEESHYVC
jgi:hypothetical protein